MNKCYESNTIAHFMHNIAIKEDTWPVVVIPWQRHHRKWPLGVLKTLEKIILFLLLGTGCGLASFTVLCLPPDSSSRKIHKMRMG